VKGREERRREGRKGQVVVQRGARGGRYFIPYKCLGYIRETI